MIVKIMTDGSEALYEAERVNVWGPQYWKQNSVGSLTLYPAGKHMHRIEVSLPGDAGLVDRVRSEDPKGIGDGDILIWGRYFEIKLKSGGSRRLITDAQVFLEEGGKTVNSWSTTRPPKDQTSLQSDERWTARRRQEAAEILQSMRAGDCGWPDGVYALTPVGVEADHPLTIAVELKDDRIVDIRELEALRDDVVSDE